MRTETLAVPKVSSLPLLASAPPFNKDPIAYLYEQSKKAGEVFRISFGLSSVVFVSSPEVTEHVLVSNAANYVKTGPFWEGVRHAFGDGLSTLEGDKWKKQRRVLSPHFHREVVSKMATDICDVIDTDIASWPTNVEVDLKSPLERITMHVLVRNVFGQSLTQEEKEVTQRAVVVLVKSLLREMLLIGVANKLKMKTKGRKPVKDLDDLVTRVIAQERAREEPSPSMLGLLIRLTGEDVMDEKQLHDEVLSTLVSGYESTANTIAWAIEFLARNPEAQEKCREEIFKAVGKNRPGIEQLAQLPQAKRIFQEAARLRPPAWFFTRVAVKDDEAAGYKFEAGESIAIFLWGLHRNPRMWDEPEVFNPDRFLTELKHKGAYIPFGLGQRLCIGRELALLEAQLIICRLLQSYRIVPTRKEWPRALYSSALRPDPGVMMRLEPLA
jgi:cytochrome P450